MDEVFTAAGEAAGKDAEDVVRHSRASIRHSRASMRASRGGAGVAKDTKKGPLLEENMGEDHDADAYDPDTVLEHNRALGLQPRNFGSQVPAMIKFRFRERVGSFGRLLFLLFSVAIGAALLFILTCTGFQAADMGGSGEEWQKLLRSVSSQVNANIYSVVDVCNWAFILSGFLTITTQYERETETGTRRHLFMHGLKPIAYQMGNFFGAIWYPLLFYISLGFLLVWKLQPFSIGSTGTVPALFLVMIVSAINVTLVGQFFGAWGARTFAKVIIVFTFFVPTMLVVFVLVPIWVVVGSQLNGYYAPWKDWAGWALGREQAGLFASDRFPTGCRPAVPCRMHSPCHSVSSPMHSPCRLFHMSDLRSHVGSAECRVGSAQCHFGCTVSFSDAQCQLNGYYAGLGRTGRGESYIFSPDCRVRM